MSLVMVMALVTGCTSGGREPTPKPIVTTQPSPSDSVRPSRSPTPMSAVTEPVRPPEMDRVDEVGAMAAAAYFMDLHEYVFATGDLERWNEVSGQSCDFCTNVRDDVERVYGSGGRYAGGAEDPEVLGVGGRDPQLGVFAVDVRYVVAPSTEMDASGAVVAQIPAEEGNLVLDVIPAERGWVLVGGDARDDS